MTREQEPWEDSKKWQVKKLIRKEHLVKQIAKHTGANFHDLGNDAHQELRTERIENALHLGTPQGDDDVGMTQTTSSGVQAEAQTTSPGVQANVRPKTTSSGTQSTTRME